MLTCTMRFAAFLTLFVCLNVQASYGPECVSALSEKPLILDEWAIKIQQDDLRHQLIRTLAQTQRQIDVGISDQDESRLLRWASYEGRVGIVDMIMSKNPANANAPDKMGMNPILLASIAGHADVIELLITYDGTNLNAVDKNKMSALMWASYKGHIRVVKVLLETDIDKNLSTEGGYTAIHLARIAGHTEIEKLMASKL